MNPHVLFLITCDPRSTHRAAEALRIAAGICPWERVKVSVGLQDAAIALLNPGAGELVDDEVVAQCLPILVKHFCPIYLLGRDPFDAAPASPTTGAQSIDARKLARLTAACDYTVRF